MEIVKTPILTNVVPKTDKPIINVVAESKPRLEVSPQNNEEKEKEKKESSITKSNLEDKIEQTNKMLDLHFTSLKFEVHDKTDRLAVKVVDKETEKVIREIPAKEYLDMISKMMDFLGILVDKKA
ncbi:flagellar protein FlaG [Bacillus sp. AK128]